MRQGRYRKLKRVVAYQKNVNVFLTGAVDIMWKKSIYRFEILSILVINLFYRTVAFVQEEEKLDACLNNLTKCRFSRKKWNLHQTNRLLWRFMKQKVFRKKLYYWRTIWKWFKNRETFLEQDGVIKQKVIWDFRDFQIFKKGVIG